MNKAKRDKLKRAVGLLDNVSDLVQSVLDKEQDCVDNYPENLQGSELFEKMENAVDGLDEAIEHIDLVKDTLEGVIAL